jgi:hypothetical protein
LIVWLTAFEKLRAVHGKPRWDIAMIFLCEKDWLALIGGALHRRGRSRRGPFSSRWGSGIGHQFAR